MLLSFRYLLGLAALLCAPVYAQRASPAGIPVLTYHRFDPGAPAPMTVTTATLESQLDFLSAHGYSVIPLSHVVEIVLGKAVLPPEPVAAVTVDDGHRSVYTVLFPIIKRRHLPVTLFIYPSAISNASYALTWAQIREMKASGLVDVQSHTFWHPDFRKEKAHRSPSDYAAFVDMQLARSQTKLNSELATHVDLLAWPYGIVDDDLKAAARHAGYRAAFAYDGLPAHPGDDPFAIHRIPVSDFARGAAFAALLNGPSSHLHKDVTHAPQQ